MQRRDRQCRRLPGVSWGWTSSAPSPARAAIRVPHHVVDVAPLSQTFDAAQYLSAAKQAISDITRRGKLPLVVGGAGLYVRALTHRLDIAKG